MDGASPIIEERLAVRTPPERLHAAVETWEDCLFMHWQVPEQAVRHLVPEPLAIDTHEGTAWLTVALLTVRDASLAIGIPLPFVSFFHHANLRTYVHLDGVPGIWLLSTDTDSQFMVLGARRYFHLSCYLAFCHRSSGGSRHLFEFFRKNSPVELSLSWAVGNPSGETVPGSLPFFLLERYCVYAADDNTVYRSRAFHNPWLVREATLTRWHSNLPDSLGLPNPVGPPLLHFAARMEKVRVWPMEKVARAGGGA